MADSLTPLWEEPSRPIIDEVRDLRTSLMGRPGSWARTHSNISYLEARRWYDRLRLGGLEVTRRVQPDGSYHIYARWLDAA